MEDMVLRKLYDEVDITVPSQKSPAWYSGRFLNLRPHVIQAVREFTLREETKHSNSLATPAQSKCMATGVEQYVIQIVEQMLPDTLQAIS